MDIILKIYSILNLKQIRRCSIIIVAMILGAILEAIGIGAILPLISIMGNPDFLTVYPKVTKYAGIFGIMTHIQFIITATFLLLILYIIKNIYLAWQNKIQIDFAIQNQIYYSEELLTEYLQKPYLYHLPSLIYVKNFSSGLPKAQIQNCANSNSCAAESAVQVRPKSQSNKTDKNKTERNHPFLPDETDRLTQREQLEDYFYQSLEVELLLRLCPDDEDAIYQIVDLLVDTCSTKRKMLRIAGDDKPVEVVRSRLKKLNADHIRFVLGCLAENTSPVRNMKQYLLAALFNAPTTMNLYYQNKTNHDFARGSPGR